MIFLVALVLLHGPDNQPIQINPDQVVSLRSPRANEGHLGKDINCLVITTDGKFISVIENCDQIRQKIDGR